MHEIRRQISSRHLSIGFRYPRHDRRCFIQWREREIANERSRTWRWSAKYTWSISIEFIAKAGVLRARFVFVIRSTEVHWFN